MSPRNEKSWNCIDRDTGEVTSVKMKYTHGPQCNCPKCTSPERAATKENTEFFTGCQDADIRKTLGCGEDDKFEYAINDFGAPGLEYKDWVTSQSVDSQVLKNHAEFVKDRFNSTGQNITGRTYALGELESDQVLWQGIRGRPQAVPVCNPTQVPDVNYDWYTSKPKFNWNSSE